MRKEVFFAIVSGIAAGLVLAFGAWRLTVKMKDSKTQDSPVPSSSSQKRQRNQNADGLSITLSSPNNLDVITSSPVKISGLTEAGSYVIFSNNNKDYMTKANSDGSFEANMGLSNGYNNLVVASISSEGQSVSAEVDLIFSIEFSKYIDNPDSGQKDATDSADTIREKIQQKLDATLKQPTAYLGTITDINESTIQLRSEGNGIQQITLSDDVSYSSDEDLAIGDFIIALGFVNGNKVLDTKRVISSKTPEKNETQAFFATISGVNSKEVSFTTPDIEGGVTIDFPKTWQGPDIKELEEGQNYIITGILTNNILALRSIFELE